MWSYKKIEEAILRYGKVLGFIVAPTYKVLERATIPTFLDTLQYTQFGPEACKSNSRWGYKASFHKYVLPNNWGEIWMQGADNAYGLEGGQFDFVWGDEGGQFDSKTYRAILGRTGQKQGSILITTTPYITNEGFGPLHKEWMPRFKEGNQDYFIVNFPSIANPAYPEEEFERAKRTLSPEQFRSRYLGEFCSVEGLVFPSFYKCNSPKDMQVEHIMRFAKTDPDGIYVGGIDFGWNDPFSALCGFLSSKEWKYNDDITNDRDWETYIPSGSVFANRIICST